MILIDCNCFAERFWLNNPRISFRQQKRFYCVKTITSSKKTFLNTLVLVWLPKDKIVLVWLPKDKIVLVLVWLPKDKIVLVWLPKDHHVLQKNIPEHVSVSVTT